MPASVDLLKRDQLLTAVPRLRAFAISLAGDLTFADDLLQETLLRAWANLDKFEPGTSMQAWLITILRNQYYSQYRRRLREVPDADGAYAAQLVSLPAQHARLDFRDLQRAIAKLRPDQREALLLIGAEGCSYEDAAMICNVAVGTLKSRVNRARLRLAELLAIDATSLAADGGIRTDLRD